MENYKQLLENILIKKAKGYTYKERTEEYSADGGSLVLTKRKVTTKHVQPDVNAVKALIELSDSVDVGKMTDEQLAVEKLRLLKLLKMCEETDKEIESEE